MNSYEQEYDVKIMSLLTKGIAFIFKWVYLINCVLCAGFTIGLLAMYIVKGNDLSNALLTSMVESITPLKTSEILRFASIFGLPKMILASVAYGFANTVFYGLIYSLITKFTHIFDTIIDGNMFTKENIDIINGSLLQSFIIAFIKPLMIYAIYTSTKIIDLSYIDISAIIYVLIVYIAKLIFTKGYELNVSNNSKLKEISDIKARENEEKMAAFKELSKKRENKKSLKVAKKETKKKTK